MLMTCNRDYCVKIQRQGTQAEEERIQCEYVNTKYDTRTNTHVGTWFLSIKPFFNELGKQGPHNFQNTIAKFLDVLETYILGKLWHECCFMFTTGSQCTYIFSLVFSMRHIVNMRSECNYNYYNYGHCIAKREAKYLL
jgi:hypothetical protein